MAKGCGLRSENLQQADAERLIGQALDAGINFIIVGAKRPDQLADNIAATQVTLSADELKQLDEVSRLPSEYPGWMLERQGQYRRQQIVDSRISTAA